MKKFLYLLTVTCLTTILPIQADVLTKLNANNDHGIWTDQRVSIGLTQNLEFRYRMEQRLGANYQKYWFYDYEGVLQYNIIPLLPECFCKLTLLTIGPGFNVTNQFQKNTDSVYHWVWINRSVLETRIAFDFYNCSIEQRIRGEYWEYTKKHYKDYALYRHRLTIFAPWKFTCLKFNPFIQNEWFLRNDTYSSTHTKGLVGGYYENRFHVGVNSTLTDHIKTSLFWQWRALKQKPGTHPGWYDNFHYCFDINLNF